MFFFRSEIEPILDEFGSKEFGNMQMTCNLVQLSRSQSWVRQPTIRSCIQAGQKKSGLDGLCHQMLESLVHVKANLQASPEFCDLKRSPSISHGFSMDILYKLI